MARVLGLLVAPFKSIEGVWAPSLSGCVGDLAWLELMLVEGQPE